MRELLHPCASCAQHIRASERVCPFCDAEVPEGFAAAARTRLGSTARPLSRAAMLFVGATAAAACGGSETTGGGGDAATAHDGSSADSAYDGPVALYGPAPVDAGMDTALDSPVAAYGPGPIDSGGG